MNTTIKHSGNLLGVVFISIVMLCFQSCDFTSSGEERLFELYEETQKFEEKADEDDKVKLSVDSLGTLKEEYAFKKDILKKLREIDQEKLAHKNQINYSLFERDLNHDIENFEFKEHLIPINHEGGFHTRVVGIPNRTAFDSLNHYKDYIKQLKSFPSYFEQNMNRMRKGIEQGQVLPRAVLVEGYKVTITSQIVDNPEKSGFYNPFNNFPDRMVDSTRQQLRKEGRLAIKEAVVPAYQSFLEFMENTYIPNARSTIAVSSLENGDDYYQHLIKYYTTEDLTPEEIHNIGLDEVERIRSEMEAIIEEVGFEGSFDEFLQFLRTDSQFYVDEGEELLEAGALIAKRMDGTLPELFNNLPREPYGIEPVPAHLAPRYTGGRYSPSSGENDAGDYWINTYAVETRPLYTLEALTFHEAVPGHHLQIALADELDDLSEIRKQAGVTAFVEGWALYAERLGLEAGFYKDPYSNFGRLTYEMWRACRLVVDTGMHALGWSRERAVDFMARNTALSSHEIDTEINRYIAVPGQALAYKMGELKIRELRREAEEKLKGKFDIGEFHDAVLMKGPVTLPLLEEQIDSYIQEKLAQ